MDKPIVKHSNAPSPIIPVRGSSYITQTWKKADWNHWEQMPHCKIWDIVALSLDLEPSNPKHEIRTWPPEYVKRMQITDAHIECGTLTRSNADRHSIDMSTYGTWALSMGWIIPDRFPRGEVVQVSLPVEPLLTNQANTAPAKTEAITGVTKRVIQRVFADLYFDYGQWGRNLGDVPQWLIPCRVSRGSKGKRVSHTWNPILIGLALMDKGITKKQLNLAFMDLKDWKDEWQEKTDLM